MPRKRVDAEAESQPRTARRSYRITGMEEVRALSHPLRLRLLELFAQSPRTTKQAAEALGEAPTRLYHHVAALEKAGLVRLRETKRKRGTTEKYFEAVTKSFLADAREALRDQGNTRDHAAVAMVVFDQARNELMRALGTAAAYEPSTALVAIRSVLRLSPRAAKQLTKKLQDLLAGLRLGQESPGSSKTRRSPLRRRYSLTIALIPADESRGEDRRPG
jgi:DNA-binding transcriptional ArsR family regulator